MLLTVARAGASLAIVAAFVIAGCSSPSPGPPSPDGGPEAGPDGADATEETDCPVGFLGDEGGAPAFDIQILEADESVAQIADGASVPMILPPQGGRVIFVGVHATNVDGCELQLTGALRDLTTQEVRVDSRTINLIDTHDGYGVSGLPNTSVSSAITNFSNVALCPNEWSPTNIYGTQYGLEVTIQDREGRQVTNKIKVTPECGQPENLDQCLCICKGGYVLGESCGDGGDE
ncbi:MAG TPA: hypothetical protein VIY73_01565 [Polyangiaceae bacterium]